MPGFVNDSVDLMNPLAHGQGIFLCHHTMIQEYKKGWYFKFPPCGVSKLIRKIGFPLVLLLIISGGVAAQESSDSDIGIDQRSFRLGGIASFAEMVRVGVKTLALSAAVSPEEMDALVDDARRIASEEQVMIYREADLIVTDLFPADVAVGKHVLLIYKGTTLDDYLALKQQKADWLKSGHYQGESRKEIARKFGKLLSYPDSIIENKIK